MKILPKSLERILKARGLTAATLSRRTGISREFIDRALAGKISLDDEDVTAIADELAVPVEALFVSANLELFSAVDFRTAHPSVSKFQKGTLKAINFAERISATLAALDLDLDIDASVKAAGGNLTDEEAIRLAEDWRARWGMTSAAQLELDDANKLYSSLREFIESLGVVVAHNSFGSDEAAGIYAKVDGGPHIILINTTKSSKARKLFTLAHEFCHLLIGAQGASNPSIVKNRIEQYCNKFAAYLLAPDTLIEEGLRRYNYKPSADNRFIRLFAGHLGISQEALIRRLVELKHLEKSQYARWRSQFNGVTPPGDTETGGGGRGKPNPLQNKRTQYGTTLIRLLGQARVRGELDELDIYRLSGLKPKYQDELFPSAEAF